MPWLPTRSHTTTVSPATSANRNSAGRQVPRSSTSSSSSRRCGGRATLSATAPPLMGPGVQRGTQSLMHGLHE